MRHHYRSLSDTKQQYRDIFQHQKQVLEEILTGFLPRFQCSCCTVEPEPALEDWIKPLHDGCGYRSWQINALDYIQQFVGRQIMATLGMVETRRNDIDCHMCGMCCRMASADAPYETLMARAKAGDDFARQFTSIFLPYESRNAARAKAPGVVDAVLLEAGGEQAGEEKIFFYHCPYVGEDNRCTVYGTEKRPAICGTYPETPLSFVYENCAWKPWKDEMHPQTLAAHATLALCEHFSSRLQAALVGPHSNP